MNYKDKIEELKAKGIFSQEQASRLSGSFSEISENIVPMTRKYSLEMIGIVLVCIVALYMVVVVGISTQNNIIEDVTESLNTPLSSGIGFGSSFVLICLLCIVGLYLVLYFLAQNAVNRFQNKYSKITALKRSVSHTVLMEKELSMKLEGYWNDVKKHKKENIEPSMLQIKINATDEEYVMHSYKEVQMSLKVEKDTLAYLEEECQSMQDTFPSNLAKLIRSLPSCNKGQI